MKNCIKKITSRLGLLARSTKGIAAVEFAMILPILLLVSFGTAEVIMRLHAYDKFTQYTLQFGDLISRHENGTDSLDMGNLTTNEIQTLYDFARDNIVGNNSTGQLEITVSSIGFDISDGEPRLLWTRQMNNGNSLVEPVNAENYVGLGEPLESILVVQAGLDANTPFTLLGKNLTGSNSAQGTNPFANGAYKFRKEVVFRPRNERALTIDGTLAESNTYWDGS